VDALVEAPPHGVVERVGQVGGAQHQHAAVVVAVPHALHLNQELCLDAAGSLALALAAGTAQRVDLRQGGREGRRAGGGADVGRPAQACGARIRVHAVPLAYPVSEPCLRRQGPRAAPLAPRLPLPGPRRPIMASPRR
jgi:hypothetical protein